MNKKYLIIAAIVALVIYSIMLPMTQDEKYCDQYSGQSEIDQPSENYRACKQDIRCTVSSEESISAKVTDSNNTTFLCRPNGILTD